MTRVEVLASMCKKLQHPGVTVRELLQDVMARRDRPDKSTPYPKAHSCFVWCANVQKDIFVSFFTKPTDELGMDPEVLCALEFIDWGEDRMLVVSSRRTDLPSFRFEQYECFVSTKEVVSLLNQKMQEFLTSEKIKKIGG